MSAQQELDWIELALREPLARPALHVWDYAAPAVVLGCSARPSGAMLERARAAGVLLCRRPTGGGAVLAGPWLLGASVALPARHPLAEAGIARSFRWFGLAHAAWLRGIGVAARAVPEARALRESALPWACFASLSHWEVEAGGGKIVGLAQCRRRNGTVFSSAVLVAAPPWELLCSVLGEPRSHAALLAERTRSCAQLLARPPQAGALAPSLLECLAGAIMRAWTPDPTPSPSPGTCCASRP
jgi:lipoate-protein ligase A